MKRVYVFPISRNALSKMKLTVPSVGAKRYPDVHCTVATVAGNPVVVVKNRAPERFLELKHRGHVPMNEHRNASAGGPAPQIAIVTVCRNALADLKLTVASVEAQSNPQVLHIVVDGASTDGTPAFLRDNAGLFHIAVSEPDKGIYDAMNKAIAFCPERAWVVFMNAGDRFAADDVLDRVAPLLRPDVDFVFGSVAIRGGEGSVRIVKARPHARTEMPGCHQSTIVRGELLRSLRFDPSYRVGADFDFFLRATRKSSRLAFHEGVIAEIAPEGYTAANEDVLQRDYVSAIARHVGKAQAAQWLLKRKLRRALLRCRDLLRRGAPV